MCIIVHLQCNHQPHQQVFSLTLCTSQLTIRSWAWVQRQDTKQGSKPPGPPNAAAWWLDPSFFPLMIFPSTEMRSKEMKKWNLPNLHFFLDVYCGSFEKTGLTPNTPTKMTPAYPALVCPRLVQPWQCTLV